MVPPVALPVNTLVNTGLIQRLGCCPGINPALYRHLCAYIKPWNTEFFNLNFHSLEVVSRYRDPQLQVSENDLNF